MADEMNFDEQLQHRCKAQCQIFLFLSPFYFPFSQELFSSLSLYFWKYTIWVEAYLNRNK